MRLIYIVLIFTLTSCNKEKHKAIFSKKYFEDGQEWYYRKTLIQTLSHRNVSQLSGHVFYPDVIRFEVRKDLLIAFRRPKKIQEYATSTPLLAFRIEHIDKDNIYIDFSKNLIVKDPKNNDKTLHLIGEEYLLDNYFEFTLRDSLNGDIRHSFLKVKTKDYSAKPYPDQVKDLLGNDVDINDRFGFFTTYQEIKNDEENFSHLKNVLMFDINKGPIVYHTNASFPKDLWEITKNVVDEWNHVLKKVVFNKEKNKYKNIQDIPDILIVKKNSCDARIGDLRFNLINTDVEEKTPWVGYGPMFSDPDTGEIISANANVNLKYLNLIAKEIVEQENISYVEIKDKEKLDLFDSVDIFDNLLDKLKKKYLNLSKNERILSIRNDLYKAILLHEIGHNLGLKHNMASANDAINFFKSFWQSNNQDEAYSSIMGHFQSPNLGKYDEAALHFVYGGLLEVFRKENLKVDVEKVDLKNWLFLNNHDDIPNRILKDVNSIEKREYISFDWSHKQLLSPNVSNSVPYMFCKDETLLLKPECLFIPKDLDLNSVYNEKQHRDIFNKFNLLLQWYFYLQQNNANFIGSFREREYKETLAKGLNHFVNVIGHPLIGPHISSPKWLMEEKYSETKNRLNPSNILIPLRLLTDCEASSLTNINESGEIVGRLGYLYQVVPFGIGRSLYNVGVNEEKKVTREGIHAIKKMALNFLFNSYSIPGLEVEASFYKLFPKAVLKILSSLIRENYHYLGPLLEDNKILKRNILDPKKFTLISNENKNIFMPSFDDDLKWYAVNQAILGLLNQNEFDEDPIRALKIAKNYNDIDMDEGYKEITFIAPNGSLYRSPIIPNIEPIGAMLLSDVNLEVDVIKKLNQCINDTEFRKKDEFCHCIKTWDRKSYDEWMCCDENNLGCIEPRLEEVGKDTCSLENLIKRRDDAESNLKSKINMIEHVRSLIKKGRIYAN